MKHKYYCNYSFPDAIKCAVCAKNILIPIEQINEELKYSTRIDKRLPGETSHFKHLHVTYYFCSEECKKEFIRERDKDLGLSFIETEK